jgi:flagellar biosynthesis protein
VVDQYDDGREKDTKDPLIPLNKKDKPEKQVAVALKYVRSPDAVPEVTAAGRGKIAEKILQIAYENGIHVREDGDLAEMLASIEIDSPIPTEAFMAVAEILSYMYQANNQRDPFDAVLEDDRQEDPSEKDTDQ